MLRAHVVVGAHHTALEDAEIAFNGVRVGGPAHVFASPVVDDLMLEGAVHMAILARVVRAKRGGGVNLLDKDWLEVGGGDALDVGRADRAATLNKREHGFLAPATAKAARRSLALVAVLFLAADERLIGFHDFAFAAKGRFAVYGAHRLANTVRHEPSGFLRNTEHTGELVAGHAELGRAKQERRQHPLMKADLAAFKQGADSHGVLLAAIVALDHATTKRAFRMGFGFAAALRRKALSVERTTVRAVRTIRPTQAFKMLAGGVFIGEAGRGDVHAP